MYANQKCSARTNARMTYCRSSSLNNSKLLFFFSCPFPFFAAELFEFDTILAYSLVFSTVDDFSSCFVCGLYNLPFSRLSSSVDQEKTQFSYIFCVSFPSFYEITSWTRIICSCFHPYFGYSRRRFLKSFHELLKDLKWEFFVLCSISWP